MAVRPPRAQRRHARQCGRATAAQNGGSRRENCLFYTSMPRTRRLGRPETIDMAYLAEPVTINRCANRQLDHPAGRYMSLDGLTGMVDDDEDFVILDITSGEDITRSILQQIIPGRAKHG